MLPVILALVLVLVVVVLAACWLSAPDSPSLETQLELHAIRQHMERTEFKAEVQRDSVRLGRELRTELDALGKPRRRM
jgi:hypothetical protein